MFHILHIRPVLSTGLKLSLLAILFNLHVVYAQETLISGEGLIINLQANQPIFLIYQGAAGETITLIARSLEAEGMIDTVIEIRYENRRLAYSQNHRTGRPDLAVTDSAIVGLQLPQNGEYLIRLDSYGSVGVGQVEMLLETVDLFEAEIAEDEHDGIVITAYLPRFQRYEYEFAAEEGEILTITAHDLADSLDSFLRLLDANGEVIASNDDHGTSDPTLDVFDSRIVDFVVPADGTYRVRVHDFLGAAGRFELIILRRTES